VNCQALQFVGIPAAGMETPPRIALRGFGAENGSLGFENGSGGMILGGDQVQGVLHSCFFPLNDTGNLGVIIG
jgi:hypothetical protein